MVLQGSAQILNAIRGFESRFPLYSLGLMLSHLPSVVVRVAVVMGLLSAPAGAPTDPKSAMKEVMDALAAGDAARLVAVMQIDSPEQRPLADAIAELLIAGRRLADAATEKFGPAAAGISDGPIAARDADGIDQARVEPDSSGRIDLYLPGQTLPVKFARGDDGSVRLSIAHYHGGQPDQIVRQAALLRLTASAMSEVTFEIGQDRYADAASLEAAVRQKLNMVLIRSLSGDPATKPATAPATQPSR